MHDVHDERGVPVSAGIPPLVRWSAIVGFIVILAILGTVIYASSYGHVWPSADSLKIKL